jgi:heme A synthase
VWFPTFTGIVGLQLVHRLGAYVVGGLAAAFAISARGDAAARGAIGIVALVLAQIALGVANVFTGMVVELAIAHAACAHAIFAATVFVVSGVLARRRAPAPDASLSAVGTP